MASPSLSGLSCTHGRLRNSTDLLCHIPGHLLPFGAVIFPKIILILGASGLMGMMVLRFKPYISRRFDRWGHVWDDPTGGGFQQVQTMTASASGGLRTRSRQREIQSGCCVSN